LKRVTVSQIMTSKTHNFLNSYPLHFCNDVWAHKSRKRYVSHGVTSSTISVTVLHNISIWRTSISRC